MKITGIETVSLSWQMPYAITYAKGERDKAWTEEQTAIVATNYTKGLVAAYTFIILLATLTTLVPYVFCSMALVLSALRGHVSDGDRSVSEGVALGTLAFVYSLMAIIGAGPRTVYWGFVLLIAGIPAYVWLVRRRTTRNESAPFP